MIMKKVFYHTAFLSLLVTSSAQSSLHNNLFDAITNKAQHVANVAKKHLTPTTSFSSTSEHFIASAYSYFQPSTLTTSILDNTNTAGQIDLFLPNTQHLAFNPKTQSPYRDSLNQPFKLPSHVSDEPAPTSIPVSTPVSAMKMAVAFFAFHAPLNFHSPLLEMFRARWKELFRKNKESDT